MCWIQWRGLERAMQRHKTIAKLPITRIVHEKWSTEEAISYWYKELDGRCLRCKLTMETHDPVYQCRSENAKKTMENALSSLRERLKKCRTVPMITELLIMILKEYRVGYETRPTITAYYSDQIKSLAMSIYQKATKTRTQMFGQRTHEPRVGIISKCVHQQQQPDCIQH